MRWLSRRSETTCAAVANAASTAAASPQRQSMQTLPGTSAEISGAPEASALAAVVTAGSGAILHHHTSAASSACARVSATTTAIGSPTWRTLSLRQQWLRREGKLSRRSAHWLPRSDASAAARRLAHPSPVSTASTPGIARAAVVHRSARSRACACGERSTTACATPSKRDRPDNRRWPVMNRASSRRSGAHHRSLNRTCHVTPSARTRTCGQDVRP